MSPAAGSVSPSDTLRDAVVRMQTLGVDPVPVVEGGRLVGALSAATIQARAAESGLSTGSVAVREVMTDAIAADEHETVEAAMSRLADVHAQAIPVVSAEGTLVGSVTLEALRRQADAPGDGTTAVQAVQSVDDLRDFDEDRVDYMSDESFPASDPPPPPSTLGSS